MSDGPYNSTEDGGKSLFEVATDIVTAGMKKTPDEIQSAQAADHGKRVADRVLAKQKEAARREAWITDQQIAEFALDHHDPMARLTDCIGNGTVNELRTDAIEELRNRATIMWTAFANGDAEIFLAEASVGIRKDTLHAMAKQ